MLFQKHIITNQSNFKSFDVAFQNKFIFFLI